ncbi:SMP-30/gluconolactonase/LRE family protein [Paraburkholderia kirstenboschensis]|uniref:L-dopachrome tautomerase-related protein n=1 Tax=Paraburkholderia kirstenboschensis TaxID=1245436 RepID=A0ABZ0EI51_9BURK|nr:L-dopachrome tautomerase-related protein [Paraburkholderia kirstenboschensis]WOD16894.1 L-dopachrome tautomerase-related protein [Paraburkholderia kirstenboschensis]
MTRFTAASAAVAMMLLSHPGFAQQRAGPSQGTAQLQQVASFEHQVTGVTVSTDGRIFVNFPRWTEEVTQVIRFDEKVAPQGSYLNDVRFSPDGRHAYLTDAGAKGALVVVDLQTGRARRVLDGHPSTQPEKDVVVKTDGQELRRSDGRGVEFAADSVALSHDGRTLYWKALTGRTLYRITTDALENPRLSEKDLEARAEPVAETEPTDGLWIDRRGRLYLSAIEQDAVKVREGDRITTLVQDKRLRWPDTFSEGSDGTIYVTSSHIQDMSWFKPEAGPRLETQLWRIEETRARQ